MPGQQFIVPVPGVQISSSENLYGGVCLAGEVVLAPDLSCPRCQHRVLRRKACPVRVLRHAVFCGKPVFLRLRVPKFACVRCRRHFMAPVPGVLPKRRSTEAFRQEVFHLHQGGLTQKHLSRTHGIATATVERWYQDFVAYRVKELQGRCCPVVLGIDEHFFTKKKGYATTFVDLRNRKVFDVVLGRSETALKAFLERLPGRDKVRVIVMDLSETYRSIVRKYFPSAMIVADRFHVIRLLNHHFMKLWQQLDAAGRKNRGLLSLMRRHQWNLAADQIPKLQRYLDNIPGLAEVYAFKQDLARLLLRKHLSHSSAAGVVRELLWHLNQCLQSPWEVMRTLGKTLQSWIEPVGRMLRFTRTNSITEGLHNKMEVISRRAYGFRNFQNYRLRVIALCGWNGVFVVRH